MMVLRRKAGEAIRIGDDIRIVIQDALSASVSKHRQMWLCTDWKFLNLFRQKTVLQVVRMRWHG